MKVKAFALAAVASPLILSGAADGAFTGLVIDTTPAPGQPANLTRVRVYANFSDAGDFMVAVAGAPIDGDPGNDPDQLVVSTTAAGGFFQATSPPFVPDNDFAPSDGFTGGQSDYLWDSFITIGREAGYASALPDETTATGIDITAWDTGGALTSNPTNGGSWFLLDAAMTTQQFPDVNGNVLLLQVTADIGLGPGDSISGVLPILQFNSGGAGAALDLGFSVPSPGALALLGLAGLAGRRRRR